ncbi:hypothetical protein DRO02_04455 [archaeon]|nr:MAG: hypothetical protein DRO02_04455 [archaeon]RLG65133.1 MAG: hypothetical protein DRO21_02685 [archaeon]HDM23727.1 DUF47 family protein [Candidatus Bathyarchaeota archaeon]
MRNNIHDLFNQCLEKVLNIVSLLDECIQLLVNEHFDQCEKCVEKIIKVENEIDEIKFLIEESISKGKRLKYLIEDQVKLLDVLEHIADRTEILARFIHAYMVKIPNEIKDDVIELSSKMLETVNKLYKAIKSIDHDLDKAYALASEVEKLKEDAVEIEFKIIRWLSQSKIDVKRVIEIKDIVSLLGRIAEKAEEATNTIKTMSMKYRM